MSVIARATRPPRRKLHLGALTFVLVAIHACVRAETSFPWSLRAIAPVDVPPIACSEAANPIDAFVLERLAKEGAAFSSEAPRAVLLRRVFVDLIGLPPSPQEWRAFMEDASPSAYERVVDRLLASPRHGERGARHWMDLAHFAETHGHDQDRIRENAWPYRDYLIASFNADKPYAKFLMEQIAGDALWPDDPQATVALGFLAAGPWDESTLRDIREDTLDRQMGRYIDRDDMLTTAMQSFASVTVQCARCHDHKFDPISQRDYYSLQAVFAGVDRGNRRYDLDPAAARRRHELRAAIATANGERKAVLEKELAALPPMSLVYAAASDFEPDASHKPLGKPRVVHVLHRGEIRQQREEAFPGTLSCIEALPARFDLPVTEKEGARRAALAEWLAHPNNPLTWRSIVNRAWQWHFGRGLVDTPNDFGNMGARPSHPELLDWLAQRFREDGGSLKRLHRLLVTSRTYRQSGAHNPALAARDADNRWLWRMDRSRLDAETVRDAALMLADNLDMRMGGPSDRQFDLKPGIHVTPIVNYGKFDPDAASGRRRSVYRFLFRTLPDPMMDALDCPAGDQLTAARNASVTVQQALALWNSAFMARQCEHLAERLSREAATTDGQVGLLCQLLFTRFPTSEEKAEFARHVEAFGLASLCRVLINSNEFIFVD